MKNLTLTPGQRLGLEAVLSQQTGRLGELAPFLRIIELVRISEPEAKELELQVTTEGGAVAARWKADAPAKEIPLEDADAKALGQVLDTWPAFKPSDLAWVLPIKDTLGKDVV